MYSYIRLISFLILSIILFACRSQNGFFSSKKSPREKYLSSIEDAGLNNTNLGRLWINAADRSLKQPLTINAPYQEKGYFAQEKPAATGYKIGLKKGEMVEIKITSTPSTGSLIFIELWQIETGKEPKLISAADTTSRTIKEEIDQTAEYIIRVQPELLKSISYTLNVQTAPSLAFPVRKSDRPQIASLWGADRDGGSRSHEGIDIFAKKHTPLLAIADGHIRRTGTNELGGKIIFLQPKGKDYSIYYAHLDSQLVETGQSVKTGEVIGLMGNTGNARSTPPHLHFGIYTNTGAVDPLPFIDDNKQKPLPITSDTGFINQYLRTRATVPIFAAPDDKSTKSGTLENASVIFITGATGNWYRIETEDGVSGFIPSNNLTPETWKKLKLKKAAELKDDPSINSPVVSSLNTGTELSVLGHQNGYYLVNHASLSGWVAMADLN